MRIYEIAPHRGPLQYDKFGDISGGGPVHLFRSADDVNATGVRSMIYRRRIIGAKQERIEILPAANTANNKTLKNAFGDTAIKIVFLETTDNCHIYDVDLPDAFTVKPPDLRDLAYKHDIVENMVKTCVSDNLTGFMFDAWDEKAPKNMSRRLFEALFDLSTVIDLISVNCEPDNLNDSGLIVSLEFEHKNGERKMLQINPII
jgi:hypothetical protein